MKKVLILTSPEGHLSIAKSMEQILQEKFKVKVGNLMKNQNGFKLYAPFYRYFPSLFQLPYKIGKKDAIQKSFKTILKTLMEKGVKKEVKSFCPDLIVSTNLFYDPALVKILDYQTRSIPYFNFVANPWTIHPLEFSHEALNLCYDQKGVKIGQKQGLGKDKVAALGWPVRQEFYQKQNLVQLRKKLGFKKDVFTLLICGGSEGTNMILKIVPSFLTIKNKLQVIVVCGSNKTLYNALTSFKKLLPKLAGTKVNYLKQIEKRLNLHVLGFTDNMAQLIQASDLVIGKAGPNLIFETVACQKPFFAICHISGQEDDNLKLIKKKGLGLVEENTFKAIRLLKKIVNSPDMLNQFSSTIKQEKENNLRVKERFLDLAETTLKAQKKR